MNNSDKTGYIYLLASKEGGTLYLGITSDLIKSIAEHKAGTASLCGELPLGSAPPSPRGYGGSGTQSGEAS